MQRHDLDVRRGARPPAARAANLRRAGQEAQHVAGGASAAAATAAAERIPGRVGRSSTGGAARHSTTGQSSRKPRRGRHRASPTSRPCAGRRARARPAAPARARGRRGCCARGTRRARPCESPRAAGPAAAARSGCPRSRRARVSAAKWRSKRTCQPTSLPERPALLVGDAPRRCARRHAPRLQHDDRPVVDQRRRHARGLAGAGRGGDDDRAARAGRARISVDERVNWKGFAHRTQPAIVPRVESV